MGKTMGATHALAVLLVLQAVRSFVLDGTRSSYGQFRKWKAGVNETLELEFKTDEPNGLILYTDDGGRYDFFEMKLVEGALRLRYNLGGGAQILTVGRDLHDGHWHRVAVTRRGERTTLGVDGATQTRTSRGKEFQFGKLSTNSDVFVGGLPPAAKLTQFSLPSVAFEEKFVGSVRNLVYADENSEVPRRQTQRNNHKCSGGSCGGSGSRDRSRGGGNGTDVCEEQDPCQHGGICMSTDSGPVCECRNSDYEGLYCEKDKAPLEASFRGSEYLTYDLNQTGGEAIVSTQDAVNLHFKTRFPNGLLFYTGDGQDFLNLALKDGGLILTMSLGNGQLEMDIRPNRVRFDDNQWHKLSVRRKLQEVTAVVDGIYSEHSHLAGSATLLSSKKVYVGGSQSTHNLPGSKIHNNFVGCMRKVEFSADTMKLNVVELGKLGSKLVSVAGHVAWQCQEAEGADPVTFTTREAHLILPDWDAGRAGTMSFKIRTNEANGLLMFSNGPNAQHPDFFAFEIIQGDLILHLDLGSGPIRIRATARRVDDGAWHEVVLRRSGRTGRLLLDGDAEDFGTPGESDLLDLSGGLHIGGVGPHISPVKIPPYLWTGVLRLGYVGCMRDLVINGNAVDVAGYARQQDSSAVRPSCHVQPAMCLSQPCLNGGLCSEGWNRYECDCSRTAFAGPVCGRDAATLTFNGTQHLAVALPAPGRSQVEDVALRFRTASGDGVLLSAGGSARGDRLSLFLTAGKLKMEIRIGDLEKSIMTGQGLNDNLWHTVKLSRRASHFNLQLDQDPPARAEKDMGQGNLLEYKELVVGSNLPSNPTRIPGFSGVMQHFSWNGVPYLELARTAYHSPRSLPLFTVTGKFSRREHPLTHHAVTFRSRHTFLGLPALKAYSSTNIFFQFKTRHPNGLILYNSGKEQDFLAVELVNGHIYYVFDLGDGPVRVRDTAKVTLNDDRWHQVTIGRPALRQHTLAVDDAFAMVTSQGHNEKLDLTGILYIGGIRKEMYQQLPKQIQSRHGFEGCLASLDLNGESPDLLIEAVVPNAQVVTGCEGSQKTKCTHSVCANRGVCVQQWSSSVCDCDGTSFTGSTCADESVSYEFGSGGGVITLMYPEDRRPEMTDDSVSLGFMTNKEDAVLFRMDSATSNDYMELEIVEGNVFMVYNLGTSDHPIGDINVRVDDTAYHVVRFARNGPNSTLQVDDYNVQTHTPSGHQLAVFNTQATLQVGGRWNPAKQKVERPFQGVMSGLVVNGQRILDLAAEKDPKTSMRGDVQAITGIHTRPVLDPFQRMQQTPPSNFPGIHDDLVYSGAGAACLNDDEDTCQPVYDPGSGDDLITPVYVPPTRGPILPKKVAGSKEFKPCDDEDCGPGSGFGELTTDDNVVKASSTPGSTLPDEDDTGSAVPETSGSPFIPDTHSTTVGGVASTTTGTTKEERKETEPPSSTTTHTSTSTTTEGTEPPEQPPEPPPELPPLPPPQPPRQPPKSPNDRKPPTSLAAQNTAVVIGVIAGSMIAVILCILIVLRFKSRSAAAYKLDDSKHCQQGPAAALLPPAAEPVMTPGMRNSRKQKDVKEWYV